MTTYKVKEGDTLSKIAKKFNTTVTAIQKANRDIVSDVNFIKTGWVLTIPTVTQTTDYEKIGKALDKCLNELDNLESFQNLCKLL